MENRKISKLTAVFFIIILLPCQGFAQYRFHHSEILQYQKQEINRGMKYYFNTEREEIRTKEWREYERLNTNAVALNFNTRNWNFNEAKQEEFEFSIETGPLLGRGDWTDSSAVEIVNAEKNVFGLRADATAGFASRYYYTNRNYTLVQVNSQARYDFLNRHLSGFSTDSNNVVTKIDEKANKHKFRFNINARAGWGIGRLNPVNHFMVAEYFLKKYYPMRNFSQDEIKQVAGVIDIIKSQRNIKTGHKAEKEIQGLKEYLNQKMFLIPAEIEENEWNMGEFLPRFNGSRTEFGPFFTFFNVEPDFVYGGYFLFKNAKYCNTRWNRDFSAGLNYNAYKKQDWVLAELNLGWSYFSKLKSQIDFGLKYVSGLVINDSENDLSLNNGIIPYLGYYTQLDSKKRIDVRFAYRFSGDENLMVSGPEVKVSVYRSKY